jgi:hypothetical protein
MITETFYLNCINDENGTLVCVEAKVPKTVASSPSHAVALVASEKRGRAVPRAVEFVRQDEELFYVPLDIGGFEKSLSCEPIFRWPRTLEERFAEARRLAEESARAGR